MSTYIDPVTETWIKQLQARIAELEITLQEIHQHYDDVHGEEVNALNARIAELEAENAIFRNADYESLQCGSRIAELEAENLTLKASALEFIYPRFDDTSHRILNLPTREDWCVLLLRDGSYAVSPWVIDYSIDENETGWDGYCVDEPIAWAYLPAPQEVVYDAQSPKSATQQDLSVSDATQKDVNND